MIRPAELAAIKAGTIDLAFRRWAKPRVVVGTRMRTGVGVIEVTAWSRSACRACAPRTPAVPGRRRWRRSSRRCRRGRRTRPGGSVWRTPVPIRARRCVPPCRTPTRSRDQRPARPPRRGVVVRRLDARDARPDRPQPDRARTRPGRAGGARDGGLQEGRPQAQGARADRVAGDRLPALAARRGGRRRRSADPARAARPAGPGTPLPRSIGAPATRALREARRHDARAGDRRHAARRAGGHARGSAAIASRASACGSRRWRTQRRWPSGAAASSEARCQRRPRCRRSRAPSRCRRRGPSRRGRARRARGPRGAWAACRSVAAAAGASHTDAIASSRPQPKKVQPMPMMRVGGQRRTAPTPSA